MDLGVYHYVSKLIAFKNYHVAHVIIALLYVIAPRCNLEGHRYIGQGCPVPKTCSGDSCFCPPLHIDVGEFCVPNDDNSTLGPDNTTSESLSKSQLNIYILNINTIIT